MDVDELISKGLTSIMVYSPEETRSFVRSTAILDELGLTIVDARIVPLAETVSLDTYCVLESDGSPIFDKRRLDEIRHRLLKALTSTSDQALKVTRRAPRQVRMFSTPVQITISRDPLNQRTVIELVAGDRPGLLFQVAKVFEQKASRCRTRRSPPSASAPRTYSSSRRPTTSRSTRPFRSASAKRCARA